MKTTPYVRRGDRERRRRRQRRLALGAAVVATGVLALRDPTPAVATAATVHAPLAALVRPSAPASTPAPVARLLAPPDTSRAVERLRRWNRLYRFAGHYGVSPELAVAIHDIAIAEGIEPALAFRLVRAESEFNERATSRVGAVGLTQVMPGTARHYVAGVSRKHLYDRRLNLHVGFRYLRGLIREYKSLRLALLVYNRGPVAVDAALKRGDDPANGYEEVVAKGYKGRGTVGH